MSQLRESTQLRSLSQALFDLFRVIGPGAIIASLTIGTGELIFSARSGVLFGYSILWVFTGILLLKWGMVFSLARHFVITGVHPVTRWMELPGPRGWLPMTLLLAGTILFPIWIGFHSGVIGTFIAHLTGISAHVAAALTLAGLVALVARGSYSLLENVQMAIVALMLIAIGVSLVLLKPDWSEMLLASVWPTPLQYPEWIKTDPNYQSIVTRPVWVEVGTYVGVIGGSSFDYLAYVAYLREKGWGNARGSAANDPTKLPDVEARQAIWKPALDLTVSFAAVLIISAAFVASGHLVLGPAHRTPNDDNMLNLQAEFLTRISTWMYPLYVVGAILTMVGTLYGTIEVAPAVFREWAYAYYGREVANLRARTVSWCVVGGAIVVLCRWISTQSTSGGIKLVDLVAPAALITGVFTCGIICFLNCWIDRAFLRKEMRMGPVLLLLNALAGVVFVGVALRGLYDFKSLGFMGWWTIAGFFGLGTAVAWLWPARSSGNGNPKPPPPGVSMRTTSPGPT